MFCPDLSLPEEDQNLGNPLLFRYPLNMGVRVVMAHCASLGMDEDFDNIGSEVASFELFMRMMKNFTRPGRKFLMMWMF